MQSLTCSSCAPVWPGESRATTSPLPPTYIQLAGFAWLLQILMQVQGNNKVYVGIMQGLRHMWLTDGVRGLFKGNGLNCIRIFPNSAIKFLTYEQLSR